MEITIHQSLCGENPQKAWDLLQTTMPDISIAKNIAFNADLQGQAGGVTWQPTIRGFLQDDYFLLMKTFPDKSPNVRPGRTFSHLLLINKNDLASITDIGSLFKFLPDEINKSNSISPITFNPNELSEISLPEEFQPRFNKVIHGYRKFSIYKNIIIWVGEENFDQAILKFWQLLRDSEKENVNIGINFNINEIPTEKLNFITIPETIESKFINAGFCLVRKNDSHTLTDISEQFLAGEISAKLRIKKFQEAIGIEILSRTDIEKIAIVIKTFEEFETTNDLKKLNTLALIIGEYSPDERKGSFLKERLVEKVVQQINECQVTEIPIIRKFNVKSFQGSESKLTAALSNWLEKKLFSVEETKKVNFSILFHHLNESASNWWTDFIYKKINTFLAKINSERAAVIFNWLTLDFSIFNEIQSTIDSSSESENYFIAQLPTSFDKSNFASMKQFALKQNWYKLHATLLISEHTFEEALRIQLSIDTELNFIDGIEIIIKNALPKQVIDFAVMNGDKRLLRIAGKLCHEDSSHLEGIIFMNIYWKELWLKSIIFGNRVTDGFKEPQKKIFELLDTLINGNEIYEEILERISETEFGNLLHYPQREKIWSKFPLSVKTKFLANTASNLLESLSKNPSTEVPSDKTLSDYIVQHAITDFLYYNRNNIKSAIPIFSTFNHLSENVLKDYIRNYTNNIDVIDATLLGRLTYARKFSDIASVINSKTNSYNNWGIALNECYLLLNSISQLVISLTGLIKDSKVTEDQWWNALNEIAYNLYTGGPAENKIWMEADGEEYDLLTKGTGKELWIAALNKLRNGGCTGITIDKLLKKMIKEYKNNEELKTILELKDKLCIR